MTVPEKKWLTIQESLDLIRQGIIDETTVTVWPDRATREAMRKDLEEFQEKRRAERERPAKPKRTRRPA
jgi:hypothetical protein